MNQKIKLNNTNFVDWSKFTLFVLLIHLRDALAVGTLYASLKTITTGLFSHCLASTSVLLLIRSCISEPNILTVLEHFHLMLLCCCFKLLRLVRNLKFLTYINVSLVDLRKFLGAVLLQNFFPLFANLAILNGRHALLDSSQVAHTVRTRSHFKRPLNHEVAKAIFDDTDKSLRTNQFLNEIRSNS